MHAEQSNAGKRSNDAPSIVVFLIPGANKTAAAAADSASAASTTTCCSSGSASGRRVLHMSHLVATGVFKYVQAEHPQATRDDLNGDDLSGDLLGEDATLFDVLLVEHV